MQMVLFVVGRDVTIWIGRVLCRLLEIDHAIALPTMAKEVVQLTVNLLAIGTLVICASIRGKRGTNDLDPLGMRFVDHLRHGMDQDGGGDRCFRCLFLPGLRQASSN